MIKRLKILNEYYTNLNYDNNKEKALEEICNLSKTVRFHCSIDFSERVMMVEDIIRKNISLFKSVCKHVDVIDMILDYLITCATCVEQMVYDITEEMFDIIFMTLLTLFTICQESAIQSFLLHFLFLDSLWDIENIQLQLEYYLSNFGLETEIIILEDSDLNAVINYLIMTDNSSLCKIWVQKRVEKKLLWLLKRHNSNLFTIDTFQSLKDIPLRACRKRLINITSIWSEDIVAAKNLAVSLNSHVIFINAHMDFFKVLFPYDKLIDEPLSKERLSFLEEIYKKESDSTDVEQSVNVVHISHIAEINSTLIRNLFYDGTWQEPIKGMYWKYNNNLWANATNDDILRCYESAQKGFEIWSMKSIQTRIQMLSKFVPILKLKSKLVLVAIVERWLKFPYLFPTVQGSLSVNKGEMIEIMGVRMSLGVIILREENENVLFFRLMQTLIAGNSVIVMFDANFCNLIQYCDMFSTCGIPPGVINLLSHEDINILGYKLCSEKYTDYANNFFSKKTSLSKREIYTESYQKLTVSKNTILILNNFDFV